MTKILFSKILLKNYPGKYIFRSTGLLTLKIKNCYLTPWEVSNYKNWKIIKFWSQSFLLAVGCINRFANILFRSQMAATKLVGVLKKSYLKTYRVWPILYLWNFLYGFILLNFYLFLIHFSWQHPSSWNFA
jgi:hypothetical protein